MAIWKLKGCPRCGGDLYLDNDEYDWYETCLQCSFRQELKEVDKLVENNNLSEKKPVLVGRRSHRKRL